MVHQDWNRPAGVVDLTDDAVHVWCVDTCQPHQHMVWLSAALSQDERERAKRFLIDEHRWRFIAGRGFLRVILSRYSGSEPHALRFEYGAQGKPRLNQDGHQDLIEFSVSHSGELAIYGVARKRIGIDLEQLRPLAAMERIAARFFSARECAELRAVPPEQRHTAFFSCWTRKEAFVKALGDGLSYPLRQFDVTLTPGTPARLVHAPGDDRDTTRWVLHELSPATDYVGAVFVEGGGQRMHCWRIEDSADWLG